MGKRSEISNDNCCGVGKVQKPDREGGLYPELVQNEDRIYNELSISPFLTVGLLHFVAEFRDPNRGIDSSLKAFDKLCTQSSARHVYDGFSFLQLTRWLLFFERGFGGFGGFGRI